MKGDEREGEGRRGGEIFDKPKPHFHTKISKYDSKSKALGLKFQGKSLIHRGNLPKN
jgi:hypothetical protein